ncbi:MAG: sigma-54-dependent Fis family transcriptional regulator [Desulfobacterales bacterium]|nr:sigma-54-dependent Fis family transcriptional regulator [Desulfobacterales bacterium]
MENNRTDQDPRPEKRLLVIDDEANMRHMLTSLLKRKGYQVEAASDGVEGLEIVKKNTYDFILCDIRMPRMDGMKFIKAARDFTPSTPLIMMSAYGTLDLAVEAMKLGAYDYISKPFKIDEVILVLKKAEERENLKKENIRLRRRISHIGEDHRFGAMIGKSRNMIEVFQLAEKVAAFDTTVLITGESGTGKELIARGIHQAGGRSAMPMVAVNCGGIPETLLESEFFGHKKGAFTGADRTKKGLFEEANKGTIFLDEIGELPLSLQVKLLRVLQEREIRSVGDSKTRKVDARVIAATAKNLEDEVRKGTFREDLFYRLAVLTIKLPPLRERTEDVPLLCRHFIRKLNRRLNREISEIAPAAMALLLQHPWAGNVRELENVIERAIVLSDGPTLQPDSFPPALKQGRVSEKAEGFYDGFSLKEGRKILEETLIIRALKEKKGNRTQAAKLLEISHPSLLSKIKTYKIDL